MKSDTLKKVMLWLVIAFIVVSIWSDPENAANTAGQFLGNVGAFFSELINRTARFITGLGGSSEPVTTNPPSAA